LLYLQVVKLYTVKLHATNYANRLYSPIAIVGSFVTNKIQTMQQLNNIIVTKLLLVYVLPDESFS
jgi:hypothetical protein